MNGERQLFELRICIKLQKNGTRLVGSLLQPRKKWFMTEENLQIGDMVYVTNENSSPGKWPVGRVIAAHPDKRGAVRVIDVKTSTTILTPANRKADPYHCGG